MLLWNVSLKPTTNIVTEIAENPYEDLHFSENMGLREKKIHRTWTQWQNGENPKRFKCGPLKPSPTESVESEIAAAL